MINKQKVTLLVDGEVLKQHILACEDQYNVQEVRQYLYHMVQEIKNRFPATEVCVNYYGVRGGEDVPLPISGAPYHNIDIKQPLRFAGLPNAELRTFWGRLTYPDKEPWLLKSGRSGKKKLTDDDFRFNEQPKGLLTQLVDAMAEKAITHEDSRLIVYGDEEDIAYAIGTTSGLDMPISQIVLDDKVPYLVDVSQKREPTIIDKKALLEVGARLSRASEQGYSVSESLRDLRSKVPAEEEEFFLMLDAGYIRRYLTDRNIRMSCQNVQELLEQIQSSLPVQPTKTIFYHAVAGEVEDKMPVKLADEGIIEFQFDKGLFSSMPDVEFSLGKTQRDKLSPVILDKNKWHLSPAALDKQDFIPNFRQYDVDDRLAYDMALARFYPKIKGLFVLTLDGDFAHSVEEAKAAGVQVSLVSLGRDLDSLSLRLKREIKDIVSVDVDRDALISRQAEEKLVRERNGEARRARLKKAQKVKKRYDHRQDDEGFYPGLGNFKPSKKERWGVARQKHKKTARKILAKRRRDYE